MKKYFPIVSIIFSFLFVLAACSNQAIIDTNSAVIGNAEADTPEESVTSVHDNQTKDTSPGQEVTVYEDGNYFYYRELIEITTTEILGCETGLIDFRSQDGQRPNITYIDDDLNLYTISTQTDPTDPNGIVYCELGRYDPDAKEYKAIVKLDSKNAHGYFLGVSESYIIWKKVYANGKNLLSELHVCDKNGEGDIVFFTDHINPETGRIYEFNYNPTVIIGDKVYFDAVTGLNDGITEMDVLCYDRITGEVNVVSNMAKRPVRYLDGIAYLKKGEGTNSRLFSYIDGRESFLMDLAEDTADYAFSGDKICRSVYNYEDPNSGKILISSMSIFYGEEEIPLIEGKKSNYTYHVQSNGEAMIWEITNPEKPVYYDIINDRFVRIDDEEIGYYGSFAGSDFIVFFTQSDPEDPDSPMRYINIRS